MLKRFFTLGGHVFGQQGGRRKVKSITPLAIETPGQCGGRAHLIAKLGAKRVNVLNGLLNVFAAGRSQFVFAQVPGQVD
ncbi:hypothetical protein SDC9_99334 [bioreactor metagenome]|uniref:Uncharacterized protein n=1 Tax=bioreactor metagenome TaxID=1076179 RepID=A0A645ASL1_9ZZZZ